MTREWGCLHRCLVAELERFAAAHPRVAGRGVRRGAHEARRAGERGDEHERAALLPARARRGGRRVHDLERALADVRELEKRRADLWQQAAHDLRGNLGVVSNVAQGLAFRDLPADRRDEFVALLQQQRDARCAICSTTSPRWPACRPARKSVASRRSTPPTLLRRLCDDVRPLADAKKLSLEGRRAADAAGRGRRGQGAPDRPEPAAQRAQVHARRQRRRSAWGDAAPGDSRRWCLSVEDSGPGFHAGPGAPIVNSLNPAAANEPLDERADSDVAAPATTTSGRSTSRRAKGLGLAIVKRLCDLLDAMVEIDTVIDKGTTVRVLLPRRYPRLPPERRRRGAERVRFVAIALRRLYRISRVRSSAAHRRGDDTAAREVRHGHVSARSKRAGVATRSRRRLRRARRRASPRSLRRARRSPPAAAAAAATPAAGDGGGTPAARRPRRPRPRRRASSRRRRWARAAPRSPASRRSATPAGSTRSSPLPPSTDALGLRSSPAASPTRASRTARPASTPARGASCSPSPDTLRQRVTLALSELMVIVDRRPRRRRLEAVRGGGLPRPARGQRVRQLPHADCSRCRPAPRWAMYLTFRGSKKANPVTRRAARRELRARADAAVHHRPGPARTSTARVKLVGGAADADLRARRHHRPGARVHRLGLRPAGPERRGRHGDARLRAPADGRRSPSRHETRRQDLPRHDDPRRHRRRAEPEASRSTPSSRHANVAPFVVAAADPAPGRQQPEPGLRRRASPPSSTTTAAASRAT